MIRKILYSILPLFVLVFQQSVAQTVADCQGLIRGYLDEMVRYNTIPEGKNYYMEMITEVHYKKSASLQDSRITIKMYMSAEKTYYESEIMSMYMDSKNTFTAIHPQKTMVWNEGKATLNQERYKTLYTLQDSLQKHSSVTSCKEMEIDGRKVKEIVYTTDHFFREATKIATQVYYYDLKERRVYKAITRYVPGSVKLEESVTYAKVDFDCKNLPMTSASASVFRTDGTFVSRYKEYELIDNRKIKTNRGK